VIVKLASTANMPPQRHGWWLDGVRANRDLAGRLPQEVLDLVLEGVEDWPMGLGRAGTLRLQRVEERTRGTEKLESGFQEYNLCEH
jgi:hypothetical protein